MAELVPGPGYALGMNIAGATPTVTRLGTFAAGTYLERLAVTVYLQSQGGLTGLRFGAGISASRAETLENWRASSKVWHPRSLTGYQETWLRLELASTMVVPFVVDIGVLVESGSRSLLVYMDLEDGTDAYTVFLSLATKRIVERLPVSP